MFAVNHDFAAVDIEEAQNAKSYLSSLTNEIKGSMKNLVLNTDIRPLYYKESVLEFSEAVISSIADDLTGAISDSNGI